MTDYISREAVLEILRGRSAPWDGYQKGRELPAADVRPVVRGKWRPYSPLTDTYECDKCGYQVIDESFRTNFYPNCGADMREKS